MNHSPTFGPKQWAQDPTSCTMLPGQIQRVRSQQLVKCLGQNRVVPQSIWSLHGIPRNSHIRNLVPLESPGTPVKYLRMIRLLSFRSSCWCKEQTVFFSAAQFLLNSVRKRLVVHSDLHVWANNFVPTKKNKTTLTQQLHENNPKRWGFIVKGLANVPIEHHPTIGDISSPTDIWRWCETNPQKRTSIPTPVVKGEPSPWPHGLQCSSDRWIMPPAIQFCREKPVPRFSIFHDVVGKSKWLWNFEQLPIFGENTRSLVLFGCVDIHIYI